MTEQAPTDEVEVVPFNPENATGFPDKTVEIQGKPTVIHETNNFRMKFGIYQNIKDRKEPENPFEEVYKEEFEKRGVNEIFRKFEESYPKLTQKMVEEILHRQQRRENEKQGSSQIITSEEASQRDLFFSMGFDAVAEIAKSIDPDFELKFFSG